MSDQSDQIGHVLIHSFDRGIYHDVLAIPAFVVAPDHGLPGRWLVALDVGCSGFNAARASHDRSACDRADAHMHRLESPRLRPVDGRLAGARQSAEHDQHRLTPDFSRHLDASPELGPLLIFGQQVALLGAGEAALG